jgi:hypothetical protein
VARLALAQAPTHGMYGLMQPHQCALNAMIWLPRPRKVSHPTDLPKGAVAKMAAADAHRP